MSKLDAQRAMREARYAARNSSGAPTRREAAVAAGTAPAKAPAADTPTPDAKPARAKTKTVPIAAAITGELCGHKSMNGRECKREAGHSEKSHRYS